MKHSVSLGGDSPNNSKPRNFFCLNKLKQVPSSRQKALILPICCTCLTIRLTLISEQPTNTSLTEPKCQSWTLIGCLAKASQYLHLKLSPWSHILFTKSFLTRNIARPQKRSVVGTLKYSRHSPFLNLGLKVAPPSKKWEADNLWRYLFV